MADLKRAYRALDPAQPARNLEHYVPRAGDPMGVLGEELKIRTSPLHVLVGGQRGVGKTTELNRLNDLLEGDGLPHTFLNTDRASGARTIGLLWGLSRRLIQDLPQSDLTVRVLKEKDPRRLSVESVRLMLRDVVESVNSFRQGLFTCLLDGYEKYSPLDIVETIRALNDIPCSFMVIVPISLLLSPQFASAIGEWDRVISVPAVSLADRNGNPDREGLAVLRAIIERRVGADAFERAALDLVIDASGGIHRELLTLAQQACLRASVAGRVQVREEEARNAIEDRRQEVSFHLTPPDLEYLLEVQTHHRITADPLALPLVERNLIVGYHGGWSWFDVHPIVKPLLAVHRKGRTP